MPRQRKDSKVLNIRLATTINERLEQYCSDSGQTKTMAVERALSVFIDDYYTQQELLKELK